jgi:hypothetical protein
MKVADLINRRYEQNKDLVDSERLLIDAWVTGTSAPSHDDEDILKAIIAYGDARVKEYRDHIKKKKPVGFQGNS